MLSGIFRNEQNGQGFDGRFDDFLLVFDMSRISPVELVEIDGS